MKKLVCLFAVLFLLIVSTAFAESTGSPIPAKKTFKSKTCDAATLAKDIEAWFREKGYKTQSSSKSDTWVVQARKTEAWRQIAGVSMAFTVSITGKPHDFSVQIGMADWAEGSALQKLLLVVHPVRFFGGDVHDVWSTKIVRDLWKFIESKVGTDKGK